MASADSNPETKRERVPEDEDSGVSMVEVLEEEEQLEADAKAVLGDSDDKNCTYPLGYIPRQALYACTTCAPSTEPPAGICLACSYECHEGHELVELYTKRNFRCDCGNNKFKETQCKLCQNKKPENSDNKYNQNFCGKYCTCHRPYPDPDDSVEDEMIQCIVCEDWYHGRHLEGKVPDGNDYDEMICQACMLKNDFLWAYAVVNKRTKVEKAETDKVVDVETKDEKVLEPDYKPGKGDESSASAKENDVIKTEEVAVEVKQSSAGSSSVMETTGPSATVTASTSAAVTAGPSAASSAPNPEGATCLLVELQQRQEETHKGATFWPVGWRAKLCKCTACKARYEAASVSFLLDAEDTVHAYEERGKQKHGTGSDYDQGLRALSSMNRVQQVEVIHGYNNMKSALTDYLKKFVENGKTVREEDIREFFSTMESRKRQRQGMQWNCK